MGMKVLGRATSINVRKVLWALDELGIACEREDWGQPVRDPRVAEFMALNPNAQVPVIIEDGFVLWESHAILRYLSETRDGALLPSEARQRAVADQWLTWQATELNPAWSYAFRALVWRSPGYREQARIEESLGRWARMMAILEQRLHETGAFVAGKAFTLADISLGLSVHRWFRTPLDHPAMPAIGDYYGRLRTRTAGGRWMTDDTP